MTGFRIRTRWSMTKSLELHTYTPSAVGTNGERVINLANLFDDESFKTADGWSMWSRELTFDDINFVNSQHYRILAHVVITDLSSEHLFSAARRWGYFR